jgi:hypothetical protein
MLVSVLGIDLGKNSCSIAGQDADGQIILRRRVATLAAAGVGSAAGGGAAVQGGANGRTATT